MQFGGLRGGAFRTFVHSPTGMAALFGTRGFCLVGRQTTLAWSIDLYAKGGIATASDSAVAMSPGV
jgi:hypothetical protein